MTIGTPNGKSYECEMRYQLGIPSFASKETSQNLSQNNENSSKQIYYVRHGDTDLNEESKETSHDQPIRGWSQVSLNQDGRDEAKKAAEGVKDLGITHIVSSDLPRAAETARIIGKKIGVTPEYEPGLRTWDLGEYTTQTGKDVHDKVNRLCNEAQDEQPPSNSKYKGESFNQFKYRVLSTMSNIIKNHNEHEVLVVSHNSPERVIHAWDEAGQPQKATI